MTDSGQRRVFLVDDHPMVREGLANLLRTAGFAVSGQAGSARETVSHPALGESHLAVVDLVLDDESGIDLVKRLRQRGMAVLVYSMHEGSPAIRQALAAGAGGYVTKREAFGSLLAAIEAVLAGARYLSPRAEAALRLSAAANELAGQQLQIYRLMGQGLSNEEIAERLGISVRTLESYCVRIMDKLGVQGVKELRKQAIRTTGPNV